MGWSEWLEWRSSPNIAVKFVAPLVVLLFRQIQITTTTNVMSSIELGHSVIRFEQLSPLRGCLPLANSTVRIARSRNRNFHPSSFSPHSPRPLNTLRGLSGRPGKGALHGSAGSHLRSHSLGPSAITRSFQQRANVSITTDGPAYRASRHLCAPQFEVIRSLQDLPRPRGTF